MADLLQPSVLLPWLLGMAFGIFVGATPGLTATMAVALIVPITFYLPNPDTGLAMILGVSFTAIFAGDIPAVYLRIPGTPASAAGTLDGHALAKKGQGNLALSLDLICSTIGGLIGVLLLMWVAPQLARFALRFSSYEYFWLAIVGLSMSAVVSVGHTGKGLLAAVLGMLLATVGIDIVSGSPRFTFGQTELLSGLSFIPAMIGLFGVSEVIRNVLRPQTMERVSMHEQSRLPMLKALVLMWRHKFTVLKSSLLGTFVGALPGAGADIAAWAAYGVAQRTSKEPETFGSGNIDGVVAPTSANNAAVAGAWIPALVFGIPGDSVTAIVLGALLMYDIKPGPLIFQNSAQQVQHIFMIALITQGLLLVAGWFGIKTFAWILRLPRNVVMVGVLVFSVVGAFAIRNSLFDVWLMTAFGVLGFYLERHKVPIAPLILGMILGPMVEESLRAGLIKSGGSLAPFFNRPICVFMLALVVLGALLPVITRRLGTPVAHES